MPRALYLGSRRGLTCLLLAAASIASACDGNHEQVSRDPTLDILTRKIEQVNTTLVRIENRLNVLESISPKTDLKQPARTTVEDASSQPIADSIALLREDISMIRSIIAKGIDPRVANVQPKNEGALSLFVTQLISSKDGLLESGTFFTWTPQDIYRAYGMPDDRSMNCWFYNVGDQSICFDFKDGMVDRVFLSGLRQTAKSR